MLGSLRIGGGDDAEDRARDGGGADEKYIVGAQPAARGEKCWARCENGDGDGESQHAHILARQQGEGENAEDAGPYVIGQVSQNQAQAAQVKKEKQDDEPTASASLTKAATRSSPPPGGLTRAEVRTAIERRRQNGSFERGKPLRTIWQAGLTSRATLSGCRPSVASAAGEITDGELHRPRRRTFQIFADA
jgi:hypothetical protein